MAALDLQATPDAETMRAGTAHPCEETVHG
jgi:hypothetical protein